MHAQLKELTNSSRSLLPRLSKRQTIFLLCLTLLSIDTRIIRHSAQICVKYDLVELYRASFPPFSKILIFHPSSPPPPLSLCFCKRESRSQSRVRHCWLVGTGNVPGSRRMFGELARGGNRDVRRWVRSTRSSAGNDFTRAIEGISTRNDAFDAVSLSAPRARHPSPLCSSLFPLLFRSRFGPDTVLGMFEPATPAVAGEKREGVCVTCPRGWQDCEHTATGLRFRVADRFKAAVVY